MEQFFLLQQQQMTETLKYQCGCGKAYTSYPAYSTHKRLKHHNQQVRGTNLPKEYVPKRGRPSFSVPLTPTTASNHYSAMTTVEVALLKLQQKYPTVLNSPEDDGDCSILDEYVDCQKLITCKTGETLSSAIKEFNSVVVNHSIESISIPVTRYLTCLTTFLLQNLSSSSIQLQWQQVQRHIQKIDMILFNKFFMQKGLKDKINDFARSAGKPMGFLLDLTVALSEYLCKVGLTEAVLALKA